MLVLLTLYRLTHSDSGRAHSPGIVLRRTGIYLSAPEILGVRIVRARHSQPCKAMEIAQAGVH